MTIQFPYSPGLVLDAYVKNEAGLIASPGAGAFVPIVLANFPQYALPMADAAGVGEYTATLAAAAWIPAAIYYVTVRKRAGASATGSDQIVGSGDIDERASGEIFGSSGSLTVTVTEVDASANPIPGVQVWISQDAGGVQRTDGRFTDDFGQAQFSLDPQNAYLWREKPGLTWSPNPLPITIAAGTTDIVDVH